MTDGPQRRPLHPVSIFGVAALGAGPVTWLWTGDWRWIITGVVAAAVLLTAGESLERRARPPAG